MTTASLDPTRSNVQLALDLAEILTPGCTALWVQRNAQGKTWASVHWAQDRGAFGGPIREDGDSDGAIAELVGALLDEIARIDAVTNTKWVNGLLWSRAGLRGKEEALGQGSATGP